MVIAASVNETLRRYVQVFLAVARTACAGRRAEESYVSKSGRAYTTGRRMQSASKALPGNAARLLRIRAKREEEQRAKRELRYSSWLQRRRENCGSVRMSTALKDEP